MAMPQSLYNAFKEALADHVVKVDGKEKKLFDLVTGSEGYYEKSEAASKIQEANKDLTDQREKWGETEKGYKDSEKALKEKVTSLESTVEDLKKGSLSPEELKKYEDLKGKGMTDQVAAEINGLKKTINDLTDTVKSEQELRQKAEDDGKKSRFQSAESGLRGRLLTELGKHNINGEQAEIAVMALQNKGYVKLDSSDDGSFQEVYRIFDGGNEIASDFENVVKEFANKNEYLKTGTQGGGSGDNHRASSSSQDQNRDGMMLLSSSKTGYDN